jgi:TonB family protein
MRRLFLALSLLIVSACSTPPAPVAAPETPPPPPVIEEKVTGTVHVTASALNVRSEPSFEGEIIAQVKTGTELGVLREEESWVKVRLADGVTGWVASRFVSDDAPSSTTKKKRAPAKRDGCPADSDYAFIDAPTPSFSEDGPHGLVVVEATVNAKGIVTSAKVISNRTGDEALAFLAVREIKAARFSPPIMDCVPRAFIFTYRRTF